MTKKFYANALMFSGEYERAFKIFDEYISETEEKKLDDEFILKGLLLQEVLNEKKITSQDRKPKEANQLADKVSNGKAFEKDLLSSLAWYNQGITLAKEKKHKDATISFAMCAMINVTDIEAWTFAFLSFLNSGKEGYLLLGVSILTTGYRYNGDKFLTSLYSILAEEGKLDDDIIEMIDSYLLNNKDEQNKGKVIRILGGEEYKEIDLS